MQFLPLSEMGSMEICGQFRLTQWVRHLRLYCKFIRDVGRAAPLCSLCPWWAVLPLQCYLSRTGVRGKLRGAFPSAQGDPGGADTGRQQWCLLLGVLSSFPTSLLPMWGELEISGSSASILQWSLQTPCSFSVCQTSCSQIKGLKTLGISVSVPKGLGLRKTCRLLVSWKLLPAPWACSCLSAWASHPS